MAMCRNGSQQKIMVVVVTGPTWFVELREMIKIAFNGRHRAPQVQVCLKGKYITRFARGVSGSLVDRSYLTLGRIHEFTRIGRGFDQGVVAGDTVVAKAFNCTRAGGASASQVVGQTPHRVH